MGVHVSFSGFEAVCGVSLTLSPGAVTAIVGPNGAGKSTLLEVIAGTRAPTTGSRSVTGSIAFVPQRTAVSNRLPVTVRDVVSIGAWGRAGWLRRIDADARRAIDVSMERLHIDDLQRAPFATLSGGQRQRTLLAQGLARGADVLLLDEPTTGLDVDSARRIRTVLRDEARRGATVACVSHDPAVIADADVTIAIDAGRLRESTERSLPAE